MCYDIYEHVQDLGRGKGDLGLELREKTNGRKRFWHSSPEWLYQAAQKHDQGEWPRSNYMQEGGNTKHREQNTKQ